MLDLVVVYSAVRFFRVLVCLCLVDLGRLCALLFWRGFRVSLLLRVGLFCCSGSCFVDCVCFSLYCALVCVVIDCCVLAFV